MFNSPIRQIVMDMLEIREREILTYTGAIFFIHLKSRGIDRKGDRDSVIAIADIVINFVGGFDAGELIYQIVGEDFGVLISTKR